MHAGLTSAEPPPPASVLWPWRGTAPVALTLLSALILVLLFLPSLAYLVIEASTAGFSGTINTVFRPLTWELLRNSLELTAAVTVGAGIIGTAAAWFVERTDLIGRQLLAVLLVIPFAVPDFVMGFGWLTFFPRSDGGIAAAVIMILTLFPLVYLPVAASLRASDASLEQVARGQGAGRWKTFRAVTLGQMRSGLVGGCLLVALIMLAEYGAFELLSFQSFTTEIWNEFQQSFSVATASVLSFLLLIIAVVVLVVLSLLQRDAHVARTGAFAQRELVRHRLGALQVPVLVGMIAVLGFALGVPIAACIHWIAQTTPQANVSDVSVWGALASTLEYCGSAALIATAVALPVAFLAVRYRSPLSSTLEKCSYLLLAMPGFTVAFAVIYFTEHDFAGALYQSGPMAVVVLATLFFPLALVGLRAAVAHAPTGLEEAAQVMGKSNVSVFFRVTLRSIWPGIAAAYCLVFLAAETEQTASMLLLPDGTQTLATAFWNNQQSLSYGPAAPFALAGLALAVVPCVVLGRYFDRPLHRRRAR